MSDDPKQPRAGRGIAETLELTEPVTCWGKTLDRLEFERPRAKHLAIVEEYEGKDFQQVSHLICALADVPMQTVERLSLEDFNRANGIISAFFEKPASPASPPSPTGDEAP